MLAYLLYAVLFFIAYYFVEQKILKNSLIKAAKRISEIYSSTDSIEDVDLTTFRKKTDYYRLQKVDMIFKPLNKDKSDLPIPELDYKGLVRFKQLIEKYECNEKPDFDFFAHKNHKHLIYPFSLDKNTIEIILLSTYNNTINDVFDRNPKLRSR
jgi:hypothetical protein